MMIRENAMQTMNWRAPRVRSQYTNTIAVLESIKESIRHWQPLVVVYYSTDGRMMRKL